MYTTIEVAYTAAFLFFYKVDFLTFLCDLPTVVFLP